MIVRRQRQYAIIAWLIEEFVLISFSTKATFLKSNLIIIFSAEECDETREKNASNYAYNVGAL